MYGPFEGKGAGLVLPFCNMAAMEMHLTGISRAVVKDVLSTIYDGIDLLGLRIVDNGGNNRLLGIDAM